MSPPAAFPAICDCRCHYGDEFPWLNLLGVSVTSVLFHLIACKGCAQRHRAPIRWVRTMRRPKRPPWESEGWTEENGG